MFSLLRRRAHFTIENLAIAHAAECVRLHAMFFAHPWSLSEFESMIASESIYGAAAVGLDGIRLAGFILIRRAADEAEILTIAVDRTAQKQGIGRQLLDAQSETLGRAGVRQLFLEVDQSNAAARKLYESRGFLQVGTRPGYYRTANGSPANALILARELK